MDGENNGKPMKTLLKWMIWGYHYFWKHPDGSIHSADRMNNKTKGTCSYFEEDVFAKR